jgi:hypothetical protein
MAKVKNNAGRGTNKIYQHIKLKSILLMFHYFTQRRKEAKAAK